VTAGRLQDRLISIRKSIFQTRKSAQMTTMFSEWSKSLLHFLPAEQDPFLSTTPQIIKWAQKANTKTLTISSPVKRQKLHTQFEHRKPHPFTTNNTTTSAPPALITQADELFGERKTTETINLLEQAAQNQPKNPEIAWRLSRTYFDISETKPDDPAWRQEWLKKGQKVASEALRESPDHFNLHKWLAFNSSGLTAYQPRDEKIKTAFSVKEHAERAAQLNPLDADVHYLLGRWKYNVASVGWIERKAAKLPAINYNDALQDFLKAEKLDHTMLRNNIFLGDTYAALNKMTEAKQFYEKALKQKPKNEAERSLVKQVQDKMTQ